MNTALSNLTVPQIINYYSTEFKTKREQSIISCGKKSADIMSRILRVVNGTLAIAECTYMIYEMYSSPSTLTNASMLTVLADATSHTFQALITPHSPRPAKLIAIAINIVRCAEIIPKIIHQPIKILDLALHYGNIGYSWRVLAK